MFILEFINHMLLYENLLKNKTREKKHGESYQIHDQKHKK